MLSACGVTRYWTPSQPEEAGSSLACTSASSAACLFSGQLKQSPEDFVVMELDVAGQCTALDEENVPQGPAGSGTNSAFHFTPPPPPAPQPSRHLSHDNSDAGDTLVTEADTLDNLDAEEALTAPAENALPLDGASLADVLVFLERAAPELTARLGTLEVVTARALQLDRQQLSAVVTGLFPTRSPVPTLAAAPESLRADWWWCAEAPLVNAPNKDVRRLVHMALRHLCPHLRSNAAPATSASSVSTAALISAVDLHYVFLVAVLGERAARVMAAWARAEGEKNTSASERAALAESDARVGAQDSLFGTAPPSLTVTFRDVPDAASSSSSTTTSADVLPALSEKDIRRSFHELRKRFYPYVSCSVQDGLVSLRYAPRAPVQDRSQRRRPREDDDNESKTGSEPHAGTTTGPAFTYVLVRKRNVETAEMRKLIAEYLRVSEGSVCIAGMKDKKGITFQRCSVPGDHVARLTGAAPTTALVTAPAEARRVSPAVVLRWPSDPLASIVEITHCAAHTFAAPVHIGELSGNRFRVRLRDVVWHASASAASATPTVASARQALTARFDAVVARGFLNYFGQQRFSESVTTPADHTGVHLFGHRYVRAVQSLYRGCPEVYDGFPDTMDARAVPGNARDAQAMTHALRQTYRMYFSEHPLTRDDVRDESPLWTQICTKAICEGTAYALRAMWVHAAQSLYFNVCASFIAEATQNTTTATDKLDANSGHEAWHDVSLPLAGYQCGPTQKTTCLTESLWHAAHAHALTALALTSEQLLDQRRVAGVPVPGSHRALLASPKDATLVFEDAQRSATPPPCETCQEGEAQQEGTALLNAPRVHCGDAVLCFSLPSSCYATIFLREVLVNSEWW